MENTKGRKGGARGALPRRREGRPVDELRLLQRPVEDPQFLLLRRRTRRLWLLEVRLRDLLRVLERG